MKCAFYSFVFCFLFFPLSVSASESITDHDASVKKIIYFTAIKYGLDPYILMSIAVMESQKPMHTGGKTDGFTVWPWTMNVSGKPYFFKSMRMAIDNLNLQLANGKRLIDIDVGLFQINLFYLKKLFEAHPHAPHFTNDQMFDVSNNTVIAALFLKSALASNPDIYLGIGHYHSFSTSRARIYGKEVVLIANKLRNLNFFKEGIAWNLITTKTRKSLSNGWLRCNGWPEPILIAQK